MVCGSSNDVSMRKPKTSTIAEKKTTKPMAEIFRGTNEGRKIYKRSSFIVEKPKKMTNLEKAVIVYLILVLGWFLGRFTEAVALGNIKF